MSYPILFGNTASAGGAQLPAGTWPANYANLISNFTGTKYYVNASIGSNSNSGLAINQSKSTIDNAIQAAASGSMIIISPGSYSHNTSGDMAESSYNNCVITDYNKDLQIVFAPGQTTLSGTNSGSRDYHISSIRNTNSKVYGAIFLRDNGGRIEPYMTAFLGFSAGESGKIASGTFYNCVFREINGNGRHSMHYDNGAPPGNARWTVEGCAFIGNTWLANYSGGNSTTARYCAAQSSSWDIAGTKVGNAVGKSFNASYQTDSTNYGVYYGTYSW